jgi:hypothetical protein
MNFYVYENWVAEGHKARIHKGSCGDCHEGKGKHPGASNKNGMWHGPFKSLTEAQKAAERTGGHISYCKHCHPSQ